MNAVFEKAFADFFAFVGSGVRFILGLLCCVVLAVIPVGAELLNDLSRYKDVPIDWIHVVSIAWPAMGAALTGYLGHLYVVDKARHEMPPPPRN